MGEELYLTFIDEDGKELKYEILMSFVWTKTNKNYIVYTDNTKDENNNLNIYAGIYKDDRIDSIETDEEWDEIDKRLSNIKEN
jgi:uncharacterized protein YrzB (UPF0473 family)